MLKNRTGRMTRPAAGTLSRAGELILILTGLSGENTSGTARGTSGPSLMAEPAERNLRAAGFKSGGQPDGDRLHPAC